MRLIIQKHKNYLQHQLFLVFTDFLSIPEMVELARDLDLEPEVVVVEMDTWRNHQLTGNRKYDNNQPQQVLTRNKK